MTDVLSAFNIIAGHKNNEFHEYHDFFSSLNRG